MDEPCGRSEVVGKKRCGDAVGGDLVEKEKVKMKISGSDCFPEATSREYQDITHDVEVSGKNNFEEARVVGTSKDEALVLIRCDSKLVDVSEKAQVMQSGLGGKMGVLDVYRADEIEVNMEKDAALASNSYSVLSNQKVSPAQCVDKSECGCVIDPAKVEASLELCRETMPKSCLPVKSHVQCVDMSECTSVTSKPEAKNVLELHNEMRQKASCSAQSHKAVTLPPMQSRAQCVEVSESASVTGPPEVKDALKVWKEMKQNGFLSSNPSHKVVTVPPSKNRVRKSKAELTKRKLEQARIEQAKKEQVDRFAKIAAPSGLLDDLNPGIINHVRNSKQVHSIIKALVRPEGHDPSANKCSNSAKIKDPKGKRELERNNYLGPYQHTHHDNSEANSTKTTGYPSAMDAPNSSVLEKDVGNEDDQNSVNSLSVKAAVVASHWLELLQQDIKGRLAALRRSKKRVRAVLQTELPNLISNEFHANQENDPYVVKSPTAESHSSIAELHEKRWNALFGQMDTTLTDEEQQLENWLEQVQEMQLLCDRGLYRGHTSMPTNLRGSENDLRPKMSDSEMELAVRAAAASIYSTCNFLVEKENIMCSQTR